MVPPTIQSIRSIKLKPLNRYKKRLISSLNNLSLNFSTSNSSSSMWLVHYYNYFNNYINHLDLSYLTNLISQTITSKSIIFYNQIHLLSEQLLYQFIYYHHCTTQIYLSLSNTFITLLRDGFEVPLEDKEKDQNNQETKTENGPCGMGEGQINKDAKDVSDQIETEDQLDETKMSEQQEQDNDQNTDEQENIDEEKNGIEVSFDFEAPMEDPSKGENEEENDNESESNDDNIDDQMGDVNEDDQGEIFDEKKWGDEQEEEEKEEEQKKQNETDKSTGKDKREHDGLTAKDDQLEELIDENPEITNNNYSEDQPPETTQNDLNSQEQEQLELPENMDLDGGNDEDENDLNLSENENNDLINEENLDKNEQSDEEEINNDNEDLNSTQNQINDLPENLPEQQLEQSVLTQDKTIQTDSMNQQQNELQQTFSNAETFEEQKQKQKQENIGQSSSKQTFQTQQISSTNQENQLTQELNKDFKSDNINKTSNQSNDQRTLSEIASFIDQNIKAAFDIEHIEDNNNNNIQDDLPSLEQNLNEQQTQIYAHAKNISKDFSQQKQILDSATEEQTKNLNQQNEQLEPIIIDNQQQENEQEQKSSLSKLQKEPIQKTNISSINEQSLLTSEINEQNNQYNSLNDKSYITTTTVEHQFNYITNIKTITNNLTEQIEYKLEEWYTNINENLYDNINNAEQLWTQLEYLTQPYVFELCEQLRLLLEPTQRTKYSGDYRTGKRLNMKRIISYIASDFRKDRIWLRRLKPSKRQYQLILAIDDSQSMDNLQVKRLALESLILLGQTLNLLDIGQFGIVSFGQYIRILQPLSQTFNHQNGIQILQQLKFDQTKTLLAELMESVTYTFSKEKVQISNPLSQLLIILSDGRGLTVSGKDRLLKSVRHAMSQNIFIVFVILDNINHEKSSSIFQINEAIFVDDKVEFRSYLDSFPFPYYLVIQNLEMLPRALIDVLRQFLELTTTNNNSNQ
ncbi:unnamed protein product [Rotaria sp. Silwood1]|nr:unnamed protein product [Rotaria sp. Silwood1]